jgi:hypothetical protein
MAYWFMVLDFKICSCNLGAGALFILFCFYYDTILSEFVLGKTFLCRLVHRYEDSHVTFFKVSWC